jgi:hypothetical protein
MQRAIIVLVSMAFSRLTLAGTTHVPVKGERHSL